MIDGAELDQRKRTVRGNERRRSMENAMSMPGSSGHDALLTAVSQPR